MTDSLTPRGPSNKPPRRNLRSRWEEQVWTTPDLNDSTRVLLLILLRHMDAQGYVSVARPALAAELNRSERRVSERLTEAVSKNYLGHVRRGQKGVTPVYRAMLPDALSETEDSPLKVQRDANPLAEMVGGFPPADEVFSGTPVGPTSSKGDHQSKPHPQRQPLRSTSERPSSSIHEKTLDVEPRGGDPQLFGEIIEFGARRKSA